MVSFSAAESKRRVSDVPAMAWDGAVPCGFWALFRPLLVAEQGALASALWIFYNAYRQSHTASRRRFWQAGGMTSKQMGTKLVGRKVWDSALKLASDIEAEAVLAYADALYDLTATEELPEGVKFILVVRGEEAHDVVRARADHIVRVPSLPFSRMDQIKLAVLLSVSSGILAPGQRIVCVSGPMSPPSLDTVVVSEIGEEMAVFDRPDSDPLPQDLRPEVFHRVLEIATELAYEGREGKSVGAIFVVGDAEAVKPFVKQLILNPFRGYPPEERNILDQRLTETVKELCSLDGAFVIAGDGEVKSGGTYLRAGAAGEELPQGLGARHAAAASISASTNAVAITVSESTGAVRVFKEGRIITELEKTPLA